MAQPLFMLAHRNGTLPQVFRVNGASPIPFGDPLPTSIIETGTSLDDSWWANRVIQFQDRVYAVAVNGVYTKTDPTSDNGPWTQDHAFTNVVGATENFHMHGPYQIVIAGVESLFVIWGSTTTASTWNAAILNGTTGVWSDVGEQIAISHTATNRYGKQLVYRGVLYVVFDTGIMSFDPGAASFGGLGLVVEGPTIPDRAGIGIFNDRLFVLGRNSSTGFMGLFEIIGGSLAFLFDTTFNDGTPAVITDAKYAIFPSPDGSVMYGLWYTTTGGAGWKFVRFIDTAGVISQSTDLTSPVLPAALRPGGGSGGDDNRWWCHYDQETTPGTGRLILFRTPAGSSGSIITQYVFVDESTEVTQEDSGGSGAHAPSNVMTGGGERIFTPGELNIEIVNRIAVIGGQETHFKAFGDPGPADKQAQFRFNIQTEVPLQLATLTGVPSVISGPAPAPTRLVNTLQGITADDGATVYAFTWEISVDSVASGSRAQLVPRIFI